jgi:hypothetical protein
MESSHVRVLHYVVFCVELNAPGFTSGISLANKSDTAKIFSKSSIINSVTNLPERRLRSDVFAEQSNMCQQYEF